MVYATVHYFVFPQSQLVTNLAGIEVFRLADSSQIHTDALQQDLTLAPASYSMTLSFFVGAIIRE